MSDCQCSWHLAAKRFCPVQKLDMQDGMHRLKTFTIFNWPLHKHTSMLDLAEAGLYYTGSSDAVKCFLCRVTLNDWKQGDIPSEEHKRLSPNCPFVKGERTYNQSIVSSPYQSKPEPVHDYPYFFG